MKYMIALIVAAAAAAPAFAAGDAKAGEKVFVACKVCHSVVAGQNRIGPSLAGVVGRKIASYPGFTYSAALKGKASNGVWTEALINTWITKPAAWAPGTKMAYAGQADAAKRADVIAYLKTLK